MWHTPCLLLGSAIWRAFMSLACDKAKNLSFPINLFLNSPLAPQNTTLSQVAMKIHEAENFLWSMNARRTSFVARSSNTGSIDSLYNAVPPFRVSMSPQNGEIRRRLSLRENGAGVYWLTAPRNEITPFVFIWNHTHTEKLNQKWKLCWSR